MKNGILILQNFIWQYYDNWIWWRSRNIIAFPEYFLFLNESFNGGHGTEDDRNGIVSSNQSEDEEH